MMLSDLFARHHCPVCDRRVRRFEPLPPEYAEMARKHGFPWFGQGETINVKNYSCPHCGASDRERLYALYLTEITRAVDSGRKPRLLHFAPEPALSRFIRDIDFFEVRTADLNGNGVDDQIDITHMTSYQDAAFDAFICSHVLEHVPDDRTALRELYRILKPGGWGILMVPLLVQLEYTLEDPSITEEGARWRNYGQGDHVRLYAKNDFLRRVADAGFRIHSLDQGHFGHRAYTRCAFKPGSTLYIVEKT